MQPLRVVLALLAAALGMLVHAATPVAAAPPGAEAAAPNGAATDGPPGAGRYLAGVRGRGWPRGWAGREESLGTLSGDFRTGGLLSTRFEQLGLPGLAARVTSPAGSWTHATGADSRGRAFGPDTPLLIGSVSKSFTATLVLRLVEEGRLGLDDTVARRLPWFRHAGITVRDLLRHTSG